MNASDQLHQGFRFQVKLWLRALNREIGWLVTREPGATPEVFEAKYWNLTQVLIWVSTGNRSFVRLAADNRYDIIELIGAAMYRSRQGPFEEFEDALRSVTDRFSNGDLPAWGRRNGQGSREKIPDEECRGLQLYPTGMAEPPHLQASRHLPHIGHPHDLRVPFWTDLVFDRSADVMRIWPDPLDGILNSEQKFAAEFRQAERAGKPVNAAAVSGAAASAIQAIPSPSKRRRHAPDGVEDWYIKEHIPAGYSTRDGDLAAARERFGRWTKDWATMRELRARNAPPSWSKSGPRSGADSSGAPEFQNRLPK